MLRTIAFGLTLAIAFLSGCSKAPLKPNIVLIIADDIATYDLGAYGNKTVQSPHIDRIAKEGIRFNNGFVTIASCSPSRSSIISGLYPHNTDAEQLHWEMTGDKTTFVRLLKEAGYWTGAAGKWHLGEAVKSDFHEVREADVSGYQIPQGGTGGFKETMAGDARSGSQDWVPILKDRPKDKPFFLWLASLDAHRPYSENIIPKPHSPDDVFVPPFMVDTPEVRKDLALYYDEITRFDTYIGAVMDELEAQGVDDNTLVLIMSDNGQPFIRAKTTLYDSGIKSPWILRWPAGIEAGLVSDSVVSAVDIGPTFLELAGVKIPSEFEGHSFVPALQDPNTQIRKFAFAEKHWHDYNDQVRAVTTGEFKYIRNYLPNQMGTPSADGVRSPAYQEALALRGTGKLNQAQKNIFLNPRPIEELYHCAEDPFEANNLAKDPEYADVLKTMRNTLREWQIVTNDWIPKIVTPDEFDRETGLATPARIRPRPNKAEMIKMGIAEDRPDS
ncbi:sulfatase family protein [Pelagicoccus mobilis]|uniref:Sulfatase n=1 Tax=Pelagicoccus mobilis TaxID=415221 RepID=A0A934RTK7_9BACT|nr:sulfatase [Pelagicoccus mobilis]MBK1876193.1 sulfatase [Pelagicoccus mobilis]